MYFFKLKFVTSLKTRLENYSGANAVQRDKCMTFLEFGTQL